MGIANRPRSGVCLFLTLLLAIGCTSSTDVPPALLTQLEDAKAFSVSLLPERPPSTSFVRQRCERRSDGEYPIAYVEWVQAVGERLDSTIIDDLETEGFEVDQQTATGTRLHQDGRFPQLYFWVAGGPQDRVSVTAQPRVSPC